MNNNDYNEDKEFYKYTSPFTNYKQAYDPLKGLKELST